MNAPTARPKERPWITPAVMSVLFLALGVWWITSGAFGPGIGTLGIAALWLGLAIRNRNRSTRRTDTTT